MSGNVLRPGLRRNPIEDEICDVSFAASPAACLFFDLLHPQKKQVQNHLSQLETRVATKNFPTLSEFPNTCETLKPWIDVCYAFCLVELKIIEV